MPRLKLSCLSSFGLGPCVTISGQVMSGAGSPGQQVWTGRRPRSMSVPVRTISWHGALPTVLGDEGQLRQLLDNLTTNAVKFVPAGRTPHVSIYGERVGDGWQITVADNGIGIPPGDRERAFGMFQRLHGEGGFPGTGIGLAICHRVVEQHGGRVWIEPNQPFGTKVCVWLRG